jgi:hypothetical protein
MPSRTAKDLSHPCLHPTCGAARRIRLFYASRATHALSRPDLDALVDAAARKNAGLGIHGALYYRHGIFAQVLEGGEAHVLQLYLRIARDPRHRDPTLINLSLTSTRLFSAWRMGFVAHAPTLGQTWEEVLDLRRRHESLLQEIFRRWLATLERGDAGLTDDDDNESEPSEHPLANTAAG